jgi:hypothetical protein
MTLARLDNEVFFKKAFTDKIVFKAFVKDIVGIDVNPDIIETEKAFQPKVGSINFKYDIFAEDSQKRIVIEIMNFENISPEEWEQSKFEASRRKVIKLEREEVQIGIAKNAIVEGSNDNLISKITGLTIEHIQELRNEKQE